MIKIKTPSMIKIKTPSTTIYMQDDGAWFQYANSPNMYPAVPPDEQNYAYSHGGKTYREAVEAIAKYKEDNHWGITE